MLSCPFVGLQEHVLIWQDLSLAAPSQKASTDLWGVYGASFGELLQTVQSYHGLCAVCLPSLAVAGISISPVSTLAWVRDSAPQLEGLPLPGLSVFLSFLSPVSRQTRTALDQQVAR